ncbi:MAG TPA: hypothetical protein PKE04_21235, partial [Clostridia bacterium]|nr:hypothetical protein [Clostridia bacterium]
MKNGATKKIGLSILAVMIAGIAIAGALRMRPQRMEDGILTRPASPRDGFSWGYLLYIPERVASPYLLVIPNNTGTVSDDLQVHAKAARNLMEWKKADADALGAALLVPVFPRPESIGHVYTHALDRDCLQIQQTEYKRLDLQLVAMIDDARKQLSQKGTALSDQVLL